MTLAHDYRGRDIDALDLLDELGVEGRSKRLKESRSHDVNSDLHALGGLGDHRAWQLSAEEVKALIRGISQRSGQVDDRTFASDISNTIIMGLVFIACMIFAVVGAHLNVNALIYAIPLVFSSIFLLTSIALEWRIHSIRDR